MSSWHGIAAVLSYDIQLLKKALSLYVSLGLLSLPRPRSAPAR